MTEQHPLTPPDELVQQIADGPGTWLEKIRKAYCAGTDQELEACCELLDINGCPGKWIDMLRAARRPKPPSLKEQALKALNEMNAPLGVVTASRCDTIRRALESLPD